MFFQRFYLSCLSHASYMIGDTGEVAVVDPQRDVDLYIEEARAHGLRIRYVIETHLHADFVSGHVELAERTGATILIGHGSGARFPHQPVREGDEVSLGGLLLRFLETPGHTPEGISVLVIDPKTSTDPVKVLTGDTLFVGEVGRPDLAGSVGYTAEQMAGMMYETLHGKLLPLPDAVEVWPAHGAGSACGRSIGAESFTTIGAQRRFNPSLQPMSKEEFVRHVTSDLPPAPDYFQHDAERNREGAGALADLPAPPALSAAQVDGAVAKGAAVLDVRDSSAFGAGHVPGALHVSLGGQFAFWSGSLIDRAQSIVLVTDTHAQRDEARLRLARVGLEAVAGYLDGGIEAWRAAGKPVATLRQVTVQDLAERRVHEPGLRVLDVRRRSEWERAHIPGVTHLPIEAIADGTLPGEPARETAVVCAGGYRSSAASSLLERAGYRNLINVIGGTDAWLGAGLPAESESPAGARA
jgi:glyoxylase-like metal-dependent hydrolase (beta-lactamase superfamily II)/rhodanese-related sulfurtransferase